MDDTQSRFGPREILQGVVHQDELVDALVAPKPLLDHFEGDQAATRFVRCQAEVCQHFLARDNAEAIAVHDEYLVVQIDRIAHIQVIYQLLVERIEHE